MNCKPGDLAIVRIDDLGFHLGKIVRVVGRDTYFRGVSWLTEPVLVDPDGGIYSPADSKLRPIRPQDDDARDETLSWLDVPTTDRVPA